MGERVEDVKKAFEEEMSTSSGLEQGGGDANGG